MAKAHHKKNPSFWKVAEDENVQENEQRGVEDLTSLTYLEVHNVLVNLGTRWLDMKPKQIYTAVSTVLIAINPYESVDHLYTDDALEHFLKLSRGGASKMRPPHPYGVGARSFTRMLKEGKNQSVVVCGESGSGKTETTKKVIKYLADTSTDGDDTHQFEEMPLETQIVQASPILEAFGNAKTILNNNSSRFGKFTKIIYADKDAEDAKPGTILGTEIETYLLEKSRVISQAKDERNFHAFYFCWAGLSPEQREEWGVEDIMDFHYTNQGKCPDSPGIDDKEWYEEMVQSLYIYKIGKEDQLNLWKMLMGILHLGNINFKRLDSGFTEVHSKSKSHVKYCAMLWDLKPEELEKRLTTGTRGKGARAMKTQIKFDEAISNRDSVAKGLYDKIFTYLAKRVSDQLSSQNKHLMNDNSPFIGVLDVFGFENFKNNSLEQFCINYTNERLQQFFNVSIIVSEQEEYIRESVLWTEIDVPNSQPMMNLVRVFFTVLQDQVGGMNAGLEAFVQKFDQNKEIPEDCELLYKVINKGVVSRKPPKDIEKVLKAAKPKKAVKPKYGATFKHYATYVEYNFEEFITKNMEKISRDTKKMFSKSKNPFLVEIATMTTKRKGGKNDGLTKRFDKSLDGLMKNLKKTEPFFVRCVNPNKEKSSKIFDVKTVEHQLIVGGLVDALRVLKEGYPTRRPYSEIYDRYHSKIQHPLIRRLPENKFAAAIMVGFGIDESFYELGLTKIFFRPAKADLLNVIMDKVDSMTEVQVQKIIDWLARSRIGALFGACKVFNFFSQKIRDNRAKENWKHVGSRLQWVVKLKQVLDFGRKKLKLKKLLKIVDYHRAYKVRQDVQAQIAEKKEVVKQIWSAYRRYRHAELMIPKLEKSVEENREKIAAMIAERKRIEEVKRQEAEAKLKNAEEAKQLEQMRIKAEKEAAEKQRRDKQLEVIQTLRDVAPNKLKKKWKKFSDLEKWKQTLQEFVKTLVINLGLEMESDGQIILKEIEVFWIETYEKEKKARKEKEEADKRNQMANMMRLEDARSTIQTRNASMRVSRREMKKERQKEEWRKRAKKGLKAQKYRAVVKTSASGKKHWAYGKRDCVVVIQFHEGEPEFVRWGEGAKRQFKISEIQAVGVGFKTRAFYGAAEVEKEFRRLDTTCVAVIGPDDEELNFQHKDPAVCLQWVNGLKQCLDVTDLEMEQVWQRLRQKDRDKSRQKSIRSPISRDERDKRKAKFNSNYKKMFKLRYMKVMKDLKRDHDAEIPPEFISLLGEKPLLEEAMKKKVKWKRLDYWIRNKVEKYKDPLIRKASSRRVEATSSIRAAPLKLKKKTSEPLPQSANLSSPTPYDG